MRAHLNPVQTANERGSRHEARAECHGAFEARPPGVRSDLECPGTSSYF